jgi:hypothetical protein
VRRQDLEHIVRAAADVTGDREIIVVGSQAILGQHPNAPRRAERKHRRSYRIVPGVHDLLISKCVAGRERDWEFAEEAIRHGLADPDELRRRVADLAVGGERLEAVRRTIDGVIARAAAKPS